MRNVNQYSTLNDSSLDISKNLHELTFSTDDQLLFIENLKNHLKQNESNDINLNNTLNEFGECRPKRPRGHRA